MTTKNFWPKKTSTSLALCSGLGCIVVAVAICVTWRSHSISVQTSKVAAAEHTAQLQKLARQAQTADNLAQQIAEKPSDNPPAETPTTVKYATSSDPRSTAYSTTPPGPSPGDVNIRITRPNQVPVGTLISSNAVKQEKAYYGGDLLISTPTITISKSSGTLTQSFTVTVPDGALSGTPSTPWYESYQYVFVAYASAPSTGTSWTPFVQVSSTTPVGTYQIHLQTSRAQQGSETWQYDGFVTVSVVE